MTDFAKLSDQDIVKLILTKDKQLYSHIISRYQDKLLRYVNYLTSYDFNAQDIVQETFIKAYVNLNGFNPKKKFSSWIYRIAHNLTMDSFRAHKKEIPLLEDMDLDSGQNLQDDAIKLELKKHTRNCLSLMPLNYREPLSLYYLEDKSYQEISDILRLPIGTIGTRINRAKILMKKICQKLKK